MKTSMVVLAAALASLSTYTMAQNTVSVAPARHQVSPPVKLSDAQLDQITAGNGAISGNLVLNQGNAYVFKEDVTKNHQITCVNCLPSATTGTAGEVAVITPNGNTILRTIRQTPF
jgi:hypothetical protein